MYVHTRSTREVTPIEEAVHTGLRVVYRRLLSGLHNMLYMIYATKPDKTGGG